VTVISKVGIRAYRSIVKATFTLGEITVVIGPSDSGKSNLVRALRDWAFNAGGTAFATEGHQMTRVAVVVGDNKILWEKEIKKRGGASRYVIVDGRTNEKTSFEKIGLNVPVEVTELTGIRPIVVDDVSVLIHFSEQGEPWFLLAPMAWTPAKVSKVIGRISGVDALILANRDLVNRRTTLNREAKTSRSEEVSIKTELEDYENLDDALARLADAEECLGRITKAKQTLQSAIVLIRIAAETSRALVTIRSEHDALSGVVEYADGGYLDRVEKLCGVESFQGKVDHLTDRKASADSEADEARADLQTAIIALEDLADSEGLVCPLCGKGAHEAP